MYCDLCKLNFSTEDEYREHNWSMLHHRKLDQEKGRDIVHKCDLCQDEFFALLAFTKHIHSEKHQKEMNKWRGTVTEKDMMGNNNPVVKTSTVSFAGPSVTYSEPQITWSVSDSQYHVNNNARIHVAKRFKNVRTHRIPNKSLFPGAPNTQMGARNSANYHQKQSENNIYYLWNSRLEPKSQGEAHFPDNRFMGTRKQNSHNESKRNCSPSSRGDNSVKLSSYMSTNITNPTADRYRALLEKSKEVVKKYTNAKNTSKASLSYISKEGNAIPEKTHTRDGSDKAIPRKPTEPTDGPRIMPTEIKNLMKQVVPVRIELSPVITKKSKKRKTLKQLSSKEDIMVSSAQCSESSSHSMFLSSKSNTLGSSKSSSSWSQSDTHVKKQSKKKKKQRKHLSQLPDSELLEYIFKRPGKDDNIQGGANTIRTPADIVDRRVGQQKRAVKELQIKFSSLREDTSYQSDLKTTQTPNLVFPTQETHPVSSNMEISSAPRMFSANVTNYSSQVATMLVNVTTMPIVVTNYSLVNSTAVVTSDSAINSSVSSPSENCDIKCKFRKSDGSQCNAPTQERFCQYHLRVIDAVKLHITKKVSSSKSSSVQDAVSLIENDQVVVTQHEKRVKSQSSKEESSKKRTLSETLDDTIGTQTSNAVNLKRFKIPRNPISRHRKNYVNGFSESSAGFHQEKTIDAIAQLFASKKSKSRFKYLRSISTNNPKQKENHINTLPPNVRKILDKKHTGASIEPRLRERTASQSELDTDSNHLLSEPSKEKHSALSSDSNGNANSYLPNSLNTSEDLTSAVSDDCALTNQSIDFQAWPCRAPTLEGGENLVSSTEGSLGGKASDFMVNQDVQMKDNVSVEHLIQIPALNNFQKEFTNREGSLSEMSTSSCFERNTSQISSLPTDNPNSDDFETGTCENSSMKVSKPELCPRETSDSALFSVIKCLGNCDSAEIYQSKWEQNKETKLSADRDIHTHVRSVTTCKTESDFRGAGALNRDNSPTHPPHMEECESSLLTSDKQSSDSNNSLMDLPQMEKRESNLLNSDRQGSDSHNSHTDPPHMEEQETSLLNSDKQNCDSNINQTYPPRMEEQESSLLNSDKQSSHSKDGYTHRPHMEERESSLLNSDKDSFDRYTQNDRSRSSTGRVENEVSNTNVKITKGSVSHSSINGISNFLTSLNVHGLAFPKNVTKSSESSGDRYSNFIRSSQATISNTLNNEQVVSNNSNTLINQSTNTITSPSASANDQTLLLPSLKSVTLPIANSTIINEIGSIRDSTDQFHDKFPDSFSTADVAHKRINVSGSVFGKKKETLFKKDSSYFERQLTYLQEEEDNCLQKMAKANERLERLKFAMEKVQSQVSFYTSTLQNINTLKKRFTVAYNQKVRIHKAKNLASTSSQVTKSAALQNREPVSKFLNHQRKLSGLHNHPQAQLCHRSNVSYATTLASDTNVTFSILSHASHTTSQYDTPLQSNSSDSVSPHTFGTPMQTLTYPPNGLTNNYRVSSNLQIAINDQNSLPDLTGENLPSISLDSKVNDQTFSNPNEADNETFYQSFSGHDNPENGVLPWNSLHSHSNSLFTDHTSTSTTGKGHSGDGHQNIIARLTNSVTYLKVFDELVFISTNKPEGALMVFDIKGKKPALYLAQKLKQPVNCMEIATVNHGSYLFTGCRGGKIEGYKIPTWELYHRSPHTTGEVLSMHFTSNILFCGFVNGLVKKLQVEKNSIEKSFERLGNKGRGVTCMTSARTNNVDILYSGSRHGIIYARSFNGDLMHKLGEQRKSSTVFELKEKDNVLYAVRDDTIAMYSCVTAEELYVVNTHCGFLLDRLKLSFTEQYLFMVDYRTVTTIRCFDLEIVFVSSFGHVTTLDIPTLTETVERVVNHAFAKPKKKPGPEKIYCEYCFTTYATQELKERHQAKYTCMVCKKCFSYSTHGLSVMLQQHMVAHHQMQPNKTGHHVIEDDHG